MRARVLCGLLCLAACGYGAFQKPESGLAAAGPTTATEALLRGDAAALQEMISADPSMLEAEGGNMLLVAAGQGDAETVQMLLVEGVSP
ncbi:MAG: hypothetical protein ACYS1C_06990, partial [Planctomycetota bacterium]